MQTEHNHSIIAPVLDPITITNSQDSRISRASQIQYVYHANMRKVPIKIYCPECKQEGTTIVTREIGAATIMIGYLLFLLTTIFCFWIPCCVDECQDAVHRCPNCQAEVGISPVQIL